MKIKIREIQTENLTRFMFSAPSWWVSMLAIFAIGGIIDLIYYAGFGTFSAIGFAYSIPAAFAYVATYPLVCLLGRQEFTWKRSGLLALAGEIFALPWLITAPFFGIPFAYVFGLGFIFAFRMFILVGVVDYRTPRMVLPAAMSAIPASVCALLIFGQELLMPVIVSFGSFAVCVFIFLMIFDLPLKRSCGLSGMHFVNVFIGHLTNGSSDMEAYFHKISEFVSVPVTTFFFRREGKKDIWFVVPNLHPGPMADIGGSNFPNILFREFQDEATVLVSHGCASHDLNMISNNETVKIATAIEKSRANVVYDSTASRPARNKCGNVSILSQKFGDSLLIVTTRSPEMTEDMDYSVGRIVMGEGKHRFGNVGFVDAHNCMTNVTKIIYPSTKAGNEFITGASVAFDRMENAEMYPLLAGVSHLELPFDRDNGFGDTGLVTLVTEAGGERTAYVLFDGNNVKEGVRETLRDAVLAEGFTDCEIMTTDSHVVNSLSGRNPVGLEVDVSEILPFVLDSLKRAVDDMSPASVGAATETCEGVEVFGPGKITQLTSLVLGIVSNLVPFCILFTVVAFFAVLIVCMIVL